MDFRRELLSSSFSFRSSFLDFLTSSLFLSSRRDRFISSLALSCRERRRSVSSLEDRVPSSRLDDRTRLLLRARRLRLRCLFSTTAMASTVLPIFRRRPRSGDDGASDPTAATVDDDEAAAAALASFFASLSNVLGKVDKNDKSSSLTVGREESSFLAMSFFLTFRALVMLVYTDRVSSKSLFESPVPPKPPLLGSAFRKVPSKLALRRDRSARSDVDRAIL